MGRDGTLYGTYWATGQKPSTDIGHAAPYTEAASSDVERLGGALDSGIARKVLLTAYDYL